MKTRNIVIGIVIVVLAIAVIGYAIFMSGDSSYYYEVSDYLQQEQSQQIKTTRVNGTLVSEERSGNSVSFVLADMNNPQDTLNVYYEGAIPDTFKIGNEVVAGGKLDTTTNTFIATELIIKCASKYEPAS